MLLSPHSPGSVGTTTPAIVYLLLVLVAALVGGLTAGLVTAGLALVAQDYYFVPPDHGFGIQDSRSAISLIVFTLAELTVCLVGASQLDARLNAERAGGRAARLQRFTSSLSRALTAQAVYDVALSEGRELLGADAGMVALPVDGGSAVEMVATFGFSEEETAAWRRFPLSQRTPIGEALESGRPVFLDEGERESLFPASGGGGAPTASVPLRVDDQTLGALGFRFEHGHVFDDDEREFAVTMGEQCAYALERARVYDAERRGRGSAGTAGGGRRAASRARSSRTRRCARSPTWWCRAWPTSASWTSSRATRCAGSWSSTPTRMSTKPRWCSSATPRS